MVIKRNSVRADLYPPLADVRHLVQLGLAEDLTPLGDITSSMLDGEERCEARLVSRSPGVIAGTLCVTETLAAVADSFTVDWKISEGDAAAGGDVLAIIEGPYAALLTAERTALNFLSHLSGIATSVAEWVRVAAGRVTVWDTRKTLPGYRSLQKAAVRAGGAANHRGNLSDWIMLKDNHLVNRDIAESVEQARLRWPGRVVHVEADTQQFAFEAVLAGANIVLLDNFSAEDLVEVVAAVREYAKQQGIPCPLLEASGGITLDALDSYAITGVDLISSGSLTNSVAVLDIGLDF